MTRTDHQNTASATIDTRYQADLLCKLGIMYATGRDCEVDPVEAHKWFNIAAIRGCGHAVRYRAQVAQKLTKPQLARALREARHWMTMH